MNGMVWYPSRKEEGKNGGGWCVAHCEKEAMRGGRSSWSEPSKWIPGGGGQFRGPLISGPVRAEQLT